MIVSVIKYCILQFFLCLFKHLNGTLKSLFGFSLHSGYVNDKNKAQNSFEHCAHRMKILWRGRMFPLMPPTNRTFLLVHKSYQHPRCIRDDDNISLMFIDEKRMLFCVSRQNVYDSQLGPFVFSSQYENVEEVISVPIKFLHRLGDFLGEPKANIILLSNTGRCGSTILTQMMEACPNTISMSEADFMTDIDQLVIKSQEHDLPSELKDFGKVLNSAVKIQCKDFKQRKVENIILKPRSQSILLAKTMNDACPQVKHVYMWRSFMPFFKSILSMGDSMPDFMFKFVVKPMFSDRLRYGILLEELKNPELQLKIENVLRKAGKFEIFALMSALQFLSYLKQRRFVNFHVVKYDDLIANPESEFRQLANFCDLNIKNMEHNLQAMQQDSQAKNEALSRKTLSKFKRSLKDEEVKSLRHIFSQMNVPQIDDFDKVFKLFTK